MASERGERIVKRLLSCNRAFFFDDASGTTIAHRALLEALAESGFDVEAVSGTAVRAGEGREPDDLLRERGLPFAIEQGPSSPRCPPCLRLKNRGLRITIHRARLKPFGDFETSESEDLVKLFDEAMLRFRPDVILTHSDDAIAIETAGKARERGIAVVFLLQELLRSPSALLQYVDAVIVPSQFSARYHRAAFGLDCICLPASVDWSRAKAEPCNPNYVTFINPCDEKGVHAFARIAHELGKRRPEIPLLVVESRGTEADLVRCGLDLKALANTHVMSTTSDPRDFWGVTRICLTPSLLGEGTGSAAIEAMINGIPLIASNRGALPEIMGDAGITLPLPDWLTPANSRLPSAEEMAPWIDTVIRLWDDAAFDQEHRRLARARSEHWKPAKIRDEHAALFRNVKSGNSILGAGQEIRSGWAVLVPFLHHIEFECDEALRRLEGLGVAVIRCRNSSAIDIVRNTLASEALRRGCESIMFIDADISFDPWDALRLFARPEPVVAGIYLKKGKAELTSSFPSEIKQVILGPTVQGLYPLEHTAAGFLRIHTSALRLMIEKLDLPLCNSDWGSGFWPFFLPLIVNRDGKSGSPHYLSEDFAFSHRLREIGVTPMADTSSRLFHHGSHGYTWEDAGSIPRRAPNHLLSIKKASEEGETTNQDKHQNRGQQKTAPA